MPKSSLKYSLKRKQIIRGSKLFTQLYQDASCFTYYPLRWRVLLRALPPDEPKLRIGVSVSKRQIRQAVKRNRIKRQLRELIRLNQWELAQNIPADQQLLLLMQYLSMNPVAQFPPPNWTQSLKRLNKILTRCQAKSPQ